MKTELKIGFDIDGVLADFNDHFIKVLVAVTGKDLFPPRPFDIPCWNYPEHYGYTREDTSLVWQFITSDPKFWASLPPYFAAYEQRDLIKGLWFHDVYFITSRVGAMCKAQTEVWLQENGFWQGQPTVLISGAKGMLAKALNLDFYLDDKWENVADVQVQQPTCQVFLLDRPWNRCATELDPVRVTTIQEALERAETARVGLQRD